MRAFTTHISVQASLLPTSYVRFLNARLDESDEPYGPNEPVDDVEVEVEYNEGWYRAGCRSGHPDNWTPDEGEDPEILSVVIVHEEWEPVENEHTDLGRLLSAEINRRLVHKADENQRLAVEDCY